MPRARTISQHPMVLGASDSTLISALVTSPAWAPALADVNLILTTVTLLLGLILGLLRLLGMFRAARARGQIAPTEEKT